ncbi:MAG: helix-turn-helix domain-containing protein [Bacilli bacterium]|jgi:transcriptional regulator with XRE-family HTH domain|nr:helix-turn-helix domain-containing protein [Bacilli bacterium]MCH4210222.1 helix-turn-helix domain-containing protein [Bacilli bacterium]MCH4228404.1 helix-turn-helix domain-containing protein [Bacilli bacterium]MCH4277909.1 helix-turn-helix domain-containing protein [Bacilli bacterium]MCI2054903.1 helix-turn-helix domain-containing protein [Bacilli bacterium]
MEELNQIVADNLTNLRKSKKITQQELAEKIGYSDKSISKWELGKAIPSVENLKHFADFYGVSVDSLLKEGGANVTVSEIKKNGNRSNQIVITAMAATFIFLVAVVIYINSIINDSDFTKSWICFIWAVPIMSLVSSILIRLFWKRCTALYVLSSITVWTTVLAFFLHFYFVIEPGQNIWFVFLVAFPVQVMIILFSKLK